MREAGELMPRNGIWPVPIQGSFLYATERRDGDWWCENLWKCFDSKSRYRN